MLVDKHEGLKGYLQDLDYSTFAGQDGLAGTPQKRVDTIDKDLKDITVRIPVFTTYKHGILI